MRASLKNLVETLLVASGAARLGRRAHRDQIRVVAFHNVVEDGSEGLGDASLHLSLSRFRAFADHLDEHYRVVPITALGNGSSSAADGRPRVVVTFDDAYRGAVTLAVSELARRGMPATVFVTPGFLGGKAFWWDSFSGFDDPSQALAFRSEALQRLRGEDAAVRSWALAQGRTELSVPASMRTATEAEIRTALEAHPGLTLGSHTWSHPNLARLPAEEVCRELQRSLSWLRERFDRVIPWLSYPYGLRCSECEGLAADTGYAGAALIEGGWTPVPPPRAYAIPRFNVPAGLSSRGFALQVAGI